jgi:hypothetical protein
MSNNLRTLYGPGTLMGGAKTRSLGQGGEKGGERTYERRPGFGDEKTYSNISYRWAGGEGGKKRTTTGVPVSQVSKYETFNTGVVSPNTKIPNMSMDDVTQMKGFGFQSQETSPSNFGPEKIIYPTSGDRPITNGSYQDRGNVPTFDTYNFGSKPKPESEPVPNPDSGWWTGPKQFLFWLGIFLVVVLVIWLFWWASNRFFGSNTTTDPSPITPTPTPPKYAEEDHEHEDHEHDEVCIGGECTSNKEAIAVLNGERPLIADCTVKFPTMSIIDELDETIKRLNKKLDEQRNLVDSGSGSTPG